MSIGKAVVICENLDSDEYSIEDKLLAVHEVMNMPTHMGVVKDTLIGIIRWLWNFNLEVGESHNGKRIVEIQTPHGDLIDRDKILKKLQRLCKHCCKGVCPEYCPSLQAINDIKSAKTVFESEE